MLVFEWDDEKNRRNRAKHGVSFEDAKAVFSDLSIMENFDDRFGYNEERVVSVGMTSRGTADRDKHPAQPAPPHHFGAACNKARDG